MKKRREMIIHVSGMDLGMQWQSQSGSSFSSAVIELTKYFDLFLSVHSMRQLFTLSGGERESS